MHRYDPLTAPDPKQWLSLDETERIRLVRDYYRRARVAVPNAQAHAALHAIVENQIALGEQIPVQRTAQRLMAEGLDRHQAIDAIAATLDEHINALLRNPGSGADRNQPYYTALEQLTAEAWLRSG
jgi:uncharacterized protein YoaH (UPF0181 family)